MSRRRLAESESGECRWVSSMTWRRQSVTCADRSGCGLLPRARSPQTLAGLVVPCRWSPSASPTITPCDRSSSPGSRWSRPCRPQTAQMATASVAWVRWTAPAPIHPPYAGVGRSDMVVRDLRDTRPGYFEASTGAVQVIPAVPDTHRNEPIPVDMTSARVGVSRAGCQHSQERCRC
jgi:hypothetical protein